MKVPRDLSGSKLAHALCSRSGYRQVNQVGSYIMRETEAPRRHRLSVREHKPLLEVAAAKDVSREDILATL